jgi:predicted outer membrane repeat protein
VGSGRTLRVFDATVDGNRATHTGGAINAHLGAAVRVERSTIRDNQADGGNGGGIAVFSGTLSVIDSTVADNRVITNNGGGIEAYATRDLLVLRSTLSGNRAGLHGGGLQLVGGGSYPARIESSTIVGNIADQDASDDGLGGGIDVAGPIVLTLHNTIVAGNDAWVTTETRCRDIDVRLNASLASDGYNWIGTNACISTVFATGLPNAALDFVGNDADLLDPQLGPLVDNGGPTPTRLPDPQSPLLDQGSCVDEGADQRGVHNSATGPRAIDIADIADLHDGCDIGSVERSVEFDPIFQDGFEFDAARMLR